MKAILILLITTVVVSNPAFAKCHDLLNFEATKLRSSETINFCEAFEGKTLLVVNTASQCGYTPQFKGLEALHKEYGDQLAIVGFPSDDFNQEYSDSEKISDVCYVNYGVTFTMLEPSSVKGDMANSIFKNLAERTREQPKWNFNKYLISADGSDVQYFPSNVAPNNKILMDQIRKNIGLN
ncbi:UNVERIFIED_CONTAM: hypothetical protein GTU68_038575 [Idotea baltica]|nr:hypothetical protein [Idotea baltica]